MTVIFIMTNFAHPKERVIGLDVFRGIAIVLMIIYHFYYDLHYFNYLELNFSHIYWRLFRYTIISCFLLSVGMSLVMTHATGIVWYKIRKRSLILGFSALAVSVVSYQIFPHSWIYFGILHFIWLASIVGLAFLNRPYLSLLLAIVILAGTKIGVLEMPWLFDYLQVPLSLPAKTEDLIRFFPWFSMVLIGLYLAKLNIHQRLFNHKLWGGNYWLAFSFLGRYSLLTYLIHQPILFALFFLVGQF